MKLAITLASLAALALSSVSCQTVPNGESSYKAYVPTAIAVAVGVVMQKATSPEDKQEKARLINDMGDGLLLLANDNTVGADIADFVIRKGGNKPHWQAFALALALAYDTNYYKVPNKQLLEVIAVQLKSSAVAYSQG